MNRSVSSNELKLKLVVALAKRGVLDIFHQCAAIFHCDAWRHYPTRDELPLVSPFVQQAGTCAARTICGRYLRVCRIMMKRGTLETWPCSSFDSHGLHAVATALMGATRCSAQVCSCAGSACPTNLSSVGLSHRHAKRELSAKRVSARCAPSPHVEVSFALDRTCAEMNERMS